MSTYASILAGSPLVMDSKQLLGDNGTFQRKVGYHQNDKNCVSQGASHPQPLG